MAEYNGEWHEQYWSQTREGTLVYSDCFYKIIHHWEISEEKTRSGSASLKLRTGGIYYIDVGCDSGDRTISIYAYAPKEGIACLAVFSPTGELVGSSVNSRINQWEKLEVNFQAIKGVYLVGLINLSRNESEYREVYFDDLEIV